MLKTLRDVKLHLLKLMQTGPAEARHILTTKVTRVCIVAPSFVRGMRAVKQGICSLFQVTIFQFKMHIFELISFSLDRASIVPMTMLRCVSHAGNCEVF
jgi:hypothetical protein